MAFRRKYLHTLFHDRLTWGLAALQPAPKARFHVHTTRTFAETCQPSCRRAMGTVARINAIVPLRRQSTRPPQLTTPLREDEIVECIPMVQRHLRSAPVVVLTYLTDVSSPWALGLSAAVHRVPLILAGQNRLWGGVAVKLPAARRVAQLLHASVPNLPVVFADGSDVFVANPVSDSLAARLRTASSPPGRVTVQSECNSWPRCYVAEYANHTAFQACRGRDGPTCYPNSGAFVGQSGTLLRFLSALERMSSAAEGAEYLDDQAALHRLYLGSPPSAGTEGLEVHVDDKSELFLGLHACKGDGAVRTFRARGGTFNMCHAGSYDPFTSVVANGSRLSHRLSYLRMRGASVAPVTALRMRGASVAPVTAYHVPETALRMRGASVAPVTAYHVPETAPLLAHAHGVHDRVSRALWGGAGVYGRPLPLHLRRPRRLSRQWQDTYATASPHALLETPVLLVDAAPGESGTGGWGGTPRPICRLTTLGQLCGGSIRNCTRVPGDVDP